MSDIAEKLLAAIEAKEARIHTQLAIPANRTVSGVADMEGDLRHCAAGREILQRFRETLSVYRTGTAPPAMAGQLGAYRNVIWILARGYGVTP